jgi:hypothetical protein
VLRKAGLSALYGVGLMGLWMLAKLNPSKAPPPFLAALAIAVVGGVFFAVGIPEIIRMVPPEVTVGEKEILWARYKSIRQWPIAEITGGAIRRATVGRHEYLLLSLAHRKSEILFGLPGQMHPGHVIDEFAGVNIRIIDLTSEAPCELGPARRRGTRGPC